MEFHEILTLYKCADNINVGAIRGFFPVSIHIHINTDRFAFAFLFLDRRCRNTGIKYTADLSDRTFRDFKILCFFCKVFNGGSITVFDGYTGIGKVCTVSGCGCFRFSGRGGET